MGITYLWVPAHDLIVFYFSTLKSITCLIVIYGTEHDKNLSDGVINGEKECSFFLSSCSSLLSPLQTREVMFRSEKRGF